ncbi:MAG TPA: amidohydrolase family protein, partial [bacterium]|nr:amidohydrolase family protein [bacterium]
MTTTEIILTGAKILDVDNKRISEGNIRIRQGLIAGIDPPGTSYHTGAEIIDVSGHYVSPGFIDSHLHIESSMVSPLAFSERVLEHGTTSVFVDPHEIANVAGTKGIDFFLGQSNRAPMDIFVGIPSCVPATPLEAAGAAISLTDIEKYVSDPNVYGLAEMMNFPGIISGNGDAREKVDYVYNYGKIVDGHCPGVSGDKLRTYVSNGHNDDVVRILSDHESTSAEEVMEKYQAGMWLMLRYGSASKDLNTILPDLLAADHPLERLLLCSDDVDPLELQEEGHVNRIITRARDIFQQHTGMELQEATLTAVALATSHPAHYFSKFFRFHEHAPVGQIATGYKANLVVFQSLEKLDIESVYYEGEMVVENGAYIGERQDTDYAELLDTVHLDRHLTAADFSIPIEDGVQSPKVRVIRAIPGSLVTESFTTSVPHENGKFL